MKGRPDYNFFIYGLKNPDYDSIMKCYGYFPTFSEAVLAVRERPDDLHERHNYLIIVAISPGLNKHVVAMQWFRYEKNLRAWGEISAPKRPGGVYAEMLA